VESLSTTTLWLAVAAAAAGTILSWAHLLGVRLVMRRLATDMGEGPVVASIEASDSRRTESLGRFATFASWGVLALLVVSMASRWRAVGHAPWSNMYEFTVAFAAAITLFYVAFERVYGDGEESASGLAAARVLGAVALPVVLAMLIVAEAFFPSDIHPLVPALQNSDLLAIHVATMILAYGALSVSFAAAVLYLVQGGNRNRFARLPKADLLDDLAYRSVMLGFPLLAAGIALGAYWANSAWGRYWGWDPKETSALVTWLVYGVYLHMRGMRGWSGTRSAFVLVGGFGAMIFSYFVVNLWVAGLHSYAGV
jgi:cytochrome c-type biogenesis protein CcsB